MSWQPAATPPPGYGTPGGHAPPPAPPGGAYGAGPTPWGPAPGLEYASFPRRLAGYLLDAVIVGVPTGTVFLAAIWSTLSSYIHQAVIAAQNNLPAPQLALPFRAVVVYGIVDCVVSALFFGVLVSAWGSTVGQRAAGVRVVRLEDPSRRLPLGRALLRAVIWWGAGALGLVPILGDAASLAVLLAVLWVIWDPRNQGLHDKLGRALVVRPASPLPAWRYGQAPYPFPPPGYPYPPYPYPYLYPYPPATPSAPAAWPGPAIPNPPQDPPASASVP